MNEVEAHRLAINTIPLELSQLDVCFSCMVWTFVMLLFHHLPIGCLISIGGFPPVNVCLYFSDCTQMI